MKTWGSWARVVVSVGVVALVGSLGTVIADWHTAKNSPQAKDEGSPEVANGTARPAHAKANPKWIENYGNLPLSFEENQGQTAREVRYVSHGSGYELFLTSQEAVLALPSKVPHDLSPLHRTATFRALRQARLAGQLTAIRLRLEGANPDAMIAGMDQLPGRANYFIGNDPKQWHTGVPSYARVKYSGIYPGVDLVFYGNQRRLEYDFVVAPGADPKAIAFAVDGVKRMRINSRGDLMLGVAGGEVELHKPVVYQKVNGKRREISGKYVLAGNHRVRFAVAAYNRSEPLILDPVLIYSSYLGGGGTSADASSAIAVDASGNAFIAGQTFSTTFPAGTNGGVVAPPATNSGASFVAEIDPTGTKLLYSTYLAGTTTNAGDAAFGIALDPSGKVYVTGATFATDFPTKNGLTISGNANGVAYVTKLDPTASGAASLLYATFLGGTGGDFANAIAADAAGNAYVVGGTDSTNFRTKNAFQSAPATGTTIGTAFLSRIDTTQTGDSSLIYSTYLGGNAANAANANGPGYGDQAFGVAADSASNAYLVGITTSTNSTFITTGTAYQTAPPVANVLASAFVSKIDTTKSGVGSLIYSTYLAGTGKDQGLGIALGPAPDFIAYVTGQSLSTDFPSPGPTTGAFDTKGTAFVTLVDTTKSGTNSVLYSTFLGGSQPDIGFAIQVDASGIAYVAGTASSSDFGGAGTLKKLGAFQPTLTNPFGTPFMAKLNPAGTGSADLLYATFFGGTGNNNDADQAFGIAIDSANPPNAYLTGQTFSNNMPVRSSLPTGGTLTAPGDAFVAKLALIPTLSVTPTSLNFGIQPVGVASVPKTVTLTNSTSAAISFTGVMVTGGAPAAANADFASPSNTCGASIPSGSSCTINVTFTPSAPASAETATLMITDSDVNSPQNVSLSGMGSNTAPGVGLAPTSLSFGPQLLNTTSAAQTVTLTNTGSTTALTITSIAASGDFAATSTGVNACPISPATLAAGANCKISVTFTPTALGTRTGTLAVMDNAGGSPQSIPLSGTGISPLVSFGGTTTLTFGKQRVGTSSAAQTVTLTNTGNVPLTISSIAFTGTNSGDFSQTNNCPVSPATLAAAANCMIHVTFKPTGTGPRTASLSVTDNAPGSPQTVSLTGTGTETPDDFDGDGMADLAVWRPSNGIWWVIPSSAPATFTMTQWGTQGDIPVPGDYDGDGKTDMAVWRPSNGMWFIIPSSNPGTPIVRQWGTQGDIPVPGDYDGDGKTDLAYWRPSTGTWFIIPSSNPGTPIMQQWGTQGDIPVPGDYDGDGKTDMAVWRPSNGMWFIIPSSNPGTPIVRQWGTQGDIPVPGDYDGDGKTDMAVWRPSNGKWWVIPSSAPTTFTVTIWGQQGDNPVPGDYDGDGKTDLAVWRPSTGTWMIIPTSNPGTPIMRQWGTNGDVPIETPIGQ